MNKRAKQSAQPDEKFLLKERDFSIPLAKGKEKEKDTGDGEGPLVGNLIGEDHVNYVLMYNMLTGIRIGVRGAPFILVLDAHSTDRYPAVRPR